MSSAQHLYIKWDQECKKPDADYEKLEKEMNQALATNPNDPEILWRLSMVIFMKSLNLINDEEIRLRTLDAFKYAQKAVDLLNAQQKTVFEAEKWLAIASGKLALLETDINEKVKYVQTHVTHIGKCVQLNPDDQMILFMQGRFQLAVSLLSEDEVKILKSHMTNFPQMTSEQAEAKLRKAIELNPFHLDCYITLAYLLIKSGKLTEAKQVIEKGLQVPIHFKSEEMIHKEMVKIKEALQ